MAVVQNDIVEVAARMQFDGSDDVVNSYQFQMTSAPPTQDLDAVSDLIVILETVYTIVQFALSVLLTFEDIRFANKSQGYLMGVHPWDTLVDGDGLANALPPGVANVVTLGTTIPNVALRKYLGVFTEEHLTVDGRWAGLLNAAAIAFGDELLDTHVGANATWEYGYDSPKTGTFVQPSSVIISGIPAYQRRRRQGRGS